MYKWKIETFSQINEREIQSNAFEVGGCKWSILIYPQGCEVGNYLLLFLCIANHDELPPGWSHFTLFTLSLMNKDPKKSKYADTSHRFIKEEYDWGWKRHMELSKLIGCCRERADRPFRCLGYEYRNELVRVYLTNAETVYWHFVEERRVKLERLLADKAWWSRPFLIATASLPSGWEWIKIPGSICKSKSLDMEEVPGPIVLVLKGMFVLGDNLLLLLKRAASEPLPPKELKGPQNRMNDVNTGEDLIELERRLTVLGCKALQTFALAYIFCNKIMVAYQEDAALKRQEELLESIHLLYLEQNHFII
ncbi:hypothetical protein SLEP1_g435 [Rubroshorea leprosula]|uniref:MATH domain-containing protein n=1 Tax=Rubroshorea leprosula TaxID=152421 RepID=A0AAV5HG59_9ROSI|nr:hypothetical protein SLEP1_g435 [Rubroshorea leprosula]